MEEGVEWSGVGIAVFAGVALLPLRARKEAAIKENECVRGEENESLEQAVQSSPASGVGAEVTGKMLSGAFKDASMAQTPDGCSGLIGGTSCALARN